MPRHCQPVLGSGELALCGGCGLAGGVIRGARAQDGACGGARLRVGVPVGAPCAVRGCLGSWHPQGLSDLTVPTLSLLSGFGVCWRSLCSSRIPRFARAAQGHIRGRVAAPGCSSIGRGICLLVVENTEKINYMAHLQTVL